MVSSRLIGATILVAVLGLSTERVRGDETADALPKDTNQLPHPLYENIDQAAVRAHLIKSGRRKFYLACSACHGRNGETRMLSGHSLLTSPIVNSDQYKPMIKLLIKGRKSMPSFALYSDDEIAGLALYVRLSIAKRSAVDGINFAALSDSVCAERSQSSLCRQSASYQNFIVPSNTEKRVH